VKASRHPSEWFWSRITSSISRTIPPVGPNAGQICRPAGAASLYARIGVDWLLLPMTLAMLAAALWLIVRGVDFDKWVDRGATTD
jgi:hypothetical protein